MEKPTLSSVFASLRAESHLTLLAIAKKCNLAETTVFKVESGRSVRWETLHIILVVGLNIQFGTTAYESLHRLWMQQRQVMAEAKPEDHATKKLSKHAASAIRKFRILIRDMDEPTVQKILAAATRKAATLQ